MKQTEKIEQEISGLRKQLKNHSLYKNLNTVEDIRIFMENHVFAVWDFMSLLKSLQNKLTNTSVPWMPLKSAVTARFINEIVLGEESDINELNEPKSHFEMYLDAMKQIGANFSQINLLLNQLQEGKGIYKSIDQLEVNAAVKNFMRFSFECIDSNNSHSIASAFTFGREDLLPDIFIEILNKVDKTKSKYSKLRYYLDRHIELDGDEHGPLSLLMIEQLCEDDTQKWSECLQVAKVALKRRIDLWDAISAEIVQQKVKKGTERV